MKKEKIDFYIGAYGLMFWLALALAIIINESKAWVGLGAVIALCIWRVIALTKKLEKIK